MPKVSLEILDDVVDFESDCAISLRAGPGSIGPHTREQWVVAISTSNETGHRVKPFNILRVVVSQSRCFNLD